jgi:hypothetical protein
MTFNTHQLRGDSEDTIRVVDGGKLPKARRKRWWWMIPFSALPITSIFLTARIEDFLSWWWLILLFAPICVGLGCLLNRWGSSQVRTLFNKVAADHDADLVVPVRTTADLSVFPPGTRAPYDEWYSQQRSRLVFVAKGDSFEIRRWPRPGRSQGVRLRFASITSVKVGTAYFFDEVNRAVVVQGIAKGRPYTVALAPLRLGTWFVAPVPDEEFLRFFAYLESKSTPAGQD